MKILVGGFRKSWRGGLNRFEAKKRLFLILGSLIKGSMNRPFSLLIAAGGYFGGKMEGES